MKMRNGYVSAMLMTIIVGFAVYGLLNIYSKVTNFFREI